MNNQVAADQEIAARLQARRHLQHFIEYVDPRFQVSMPPHVPLICREVEQAVTYAESGHGTELLVIAIPPGHLKTTVVSDYLTAWFHGRNPDKRVINTSYSGNLAEDSSARVRDMIQNDERYAAVFGERATFRIDDDGERQAEVAVSSDTSAKGKWKIDGDGGEHFAVGFGGTVTGRRAHLIIVDDPYASRQEAESAATQAHVIQFFRSTLWSRRQNPCAIVIIMQLWNDEDLVGWLERVTDPLHPDHIPDFPPLRVVKLAALALPGDPLGRPEGKALWPGFQDEKEHKKTRAVLGDYYFNSQYQQTPTEKAGNIFKRTWFRVVPKTDISYKIQYWDTAEKDKQENDYWGGVTLGVTKYGILILDIVYEKMTPDIGMEEIYRSYDQHNLENEPVSVVWVEDKSSGGPLVSIMQAATDRIIPIDAHKPVGDKISRANAVVHACRSGRVQLLYGAPWIATFLREMAVFPFGVNDDLPDAVVGGLSKLLHGGHVRTGDAARRAEAKEGRDTSQAPTHEDRHQAVFGKKSGSSKRGMRLQRPPGQ